MRELLIVQPSLILPREFVDYPYFVGLGAYRAAAVLRNAGWCVRVLDGFARDDAGLFLAGDRAWLGTRRSAFLAALRSDPSNVVLINASPFLLSPMAREWLTELVVELRKSSERSIVLAELYQGGMHYVEYEPRQLLKSLPGISALLRYECEPMLSGLEDALANARESAPLVLENRTAFSLEGLPAPAFDLLESDAFFTFLERALGSEWRPGPIPATPRRTLPLITSRGCWYNCEFCSKNPGLPEPRNQLRFVELGSIERALKRWQGLFGVERIVLLDEFPNAIPGRFDAFLTIVEQLGLRLEIPNGVRADHLNQHQVSRLAGLTSRLPISLESASRRTQFELLGKRLEPDAVNKVAQWCAEARLGLDVHCLVGIPGESNAELRRTVKAAIDIHQEFGARFLPQLPVPIPGTRLDQRLRASGWIPADTYDVEEAFAKPVELEGVTQSAYAREAARLIVRTTWAQPPKVIVNLSYKCNNHCTFCAVGDRKQVDSPTEDVLKTIAEYSRRGYEYLDLDGGEPTLHPDLLAIIDEAKRLGYAHVTVITNGRRLAYRAFMDCLADSGVDEVLVSLHAAEPQLQDMLTSIPGSFEQTTQGIRNVLRRMRADQLGINTTVVAANVARLPELGRLLGELGAKRWNIQLITPFGRANAAQAPSLQVLTQTLLPLLANPPPGLRVSLVNCSPCLVPGYEHLASQDFGKAYRDMVFVGASGQNLQGYLSEKRRQDDRCTECLYSPICPGHYVFAD